MSWPVNDLESILAVGVAWRWMAQHGEVSARLPGRRSELLFGNGFDAAVTPRLSLIPQKAVVDNRLGLGQKGGKSEGRRWGVGGGGG